jgi:hypothetical protein
MSISFRGQVVSTELENGASLMTQDTIIFRYPKENITSKSLFIVQPTERCIVIIQGQIAQTSLPELIIYNPLQIPSLHSSPSLGINRYLTIL